MGRKRMFVQNYHKIEKNIGVLNDINWEHHIKQYVRGMRKYAFKDNSSDEEAETSLRQLRRKHQIVKFLVLSNLLIEPIFDPLRELLPQAFAKVVPIEGDITLPLLGISSDNLSLLRKTVSVVIHSAATVKFDEPLNVAMNINLGGTSKVLELAESMELIKAVVYVSTAFSNCERSFIEEKIYPVRIDPVTAITMYQKCDEDFLEAIKPVLVGDKPNTYVLTKHLAEELVNQWKMAVPVCVVRPSIVIAAYKHPIPGTRVVVKVLRLPCAS
ncbi:unnamed protein product [Allacma fusca]|uniref:Fatty acyl-CoA reductase n=1 Tax=Allacma fusca TaxID=39272 RepID=A0A8J2KT44_9HEXA|nr:unnamed protein product [Allacma fusca]